MDGLERLSAVEQFGLLERGEVSGEELRDAGLAGCERLDPSLHFLASPLIERAPPGVPMLLKDAGAGAGRDRSLRRRGRAPGRGCDLVGHHLLDHDPERGMTVHPACRDGVHAAACLLEALGHDVEPGWPAPLGRLWQACLPYFVVLRDSTKPSVIAWVSERLGRPVRRGELEDAIFDEAEAAAGRSAEEVAGARAALDAVVAPITDWWQDHDLLVTPSTFQPAWPLGGSPGPAEIGTLAAPFSFTGQPSLSVPLHQTDDGLPVGVQIVGRRGADELLLELAQTLEDATGWTRSRPPVH